MTKTITLPDSDEVEVRWLPTERDEWTDTMGTWRITPIRLSEAKELCEKEFSQPKKEEAMAETIMPSSQDVAGIGVSSVRESTDNLNKKETSMFTEMRNRNKKAVKEGLELEVGERALKNTMALIKKALPDSASSILDIPGFDYIVANALNALAMMYTGPKTEFVNDIARKTMVVSAKDKAELLGGCIEDLFSLIAAPKGGVKNE